MIRRFINNKFDDLEVIIISLTIIKRFAILLNNYVILKFINYNSYLRFSSRILSTVNSFEKKSNTASQLQNSGLNAPRAFCNDESFHLLVDKLDEYYSPTRDDCIKLLNKVILLYFFNFFNTVTIQYLFLLQFRTFEPIKN